MSPHNTPGKCVNLILKAIIGTKTLGKCTRTGRESNRKLGAKKKHSTDIEDENEDKTENKPEKLDETKLNLCFGKYNTLLLKLFLSCTIKETAIVLLIYCLVIVTIKF